MNTRFGLVLVAVLAGLSPALTVGSGPAAARETRPWCVGHLGRIPVPPPILGIPFWDCPHGKGRWPGWQHG